jgi:hypothetical protein
VDGSLLGSFRTHKALNEYEIVQLGEYCQDLLNQDLFNKVVALFGQQTTQDFLSTQPEEKAKREGIYASYKGVSELLGLMNAFIEEKNAIINRDKQALPEDEGALPQEID